MSDLEVDAVEDGWLLLRSSDGARHRVRADDAVRRVVDASELTVAPVPAPPPDEPAADAVSSLPPREIQARLRRGVPAEDIAREAGTSVERVRRWEAPVLAERAAAVERARATRFSRPPDATAVGPLGTLVDARLKAVGVEGEWDAWREADGAWTVQVTHRDGQARWRLDAAGLSGLDRNAEQLGWAVRPHLVRTPPEPERPTPVEEMPTEVVRKPPARAGRERARRSALPSWEDILDNTPPPNVFPT